MHIFHKWSKWERYQWRGMRWSVLTNRHGTFKSEPDEVTEERQKRHCETCGLSQDVRV